jgi:hypothetical protein
MRNSPEVNHNWLKAQDAVIIRDSLYRRWQCRGTPTPMKRGAPIAIITMAG